jgi:hypothetical protein
LDISGSSCAPPPGAPSIGGNTALTFMKLWARLSKRFDRQSRIAPVWSARIDKEMHHAKA